MSKFEEMVEEYYYKLMVNGKDSAAAWLDEELTKDRTHKAIKSFIINSIEQAQNTIENAPEDVLDQAHQEYLDKINKKGVH